MGLASAIWTGFKGLFNLGSERRIHAERSAKYLRSDSFARIQAKYASAQTTYQNEAFWRLTDSMSAAGANSLDVRKRLRERGRYLFDSNCHAKGICVLQANDMIGTGARFQALYEDEGLCDALESAWNEWATAIELDAKMHEMEMARHHSGEGFGLLFINESLPVSVQLDVATRECDMVSTPDNMRVTSPNAVDGIEFDRNGTPVVYHLLDQHPGDTGGIGYGASARRIPAKEMLHWFQRTRSGQVRGVPSLTPAMPILAQLGRYSLATLMAAEIAADFAAFVYTDQKAGEIDTEGDLGADFPQAWDKRPVEKGTIQALPDGWKIEQLKPNQPITSYAEYTKALLREACHAMLIPYNIANADFEGDSYAGGRMSLQVYQRNIRVNRSHFKTRILERIFQAWLDMAVLVPKLLPDGVAARASQIPHAWYFDGWGHVDPTKEATATTTRLSNFTTTLASECAEGGQDWRKVIRQRAREIEMQKKLGVLILPPGTPPLDSDGAETTTSQITQDQVAEELSNAA